MLSKEVKNMSAMSTVHTKRIVRPLKRWAQIRQEINLPLETIERTATDRDQWKKCVQ